ncbi:MAG: 16S rRNA (cytidine(1402)-2'-O)-methyltransferase [Candidatus Moraniibacteriota bacterium]|nr:MAG: 16S rRNA (cytidine(1402)-2'-O)-methyltransferase [Candidatus Moranbacteria bacterium]
MFREDQETESIDVDECSAEKSAPLFVVATPIGNMEDITLRALRILEESDLIVCEDTRVAKKLLFRHGISKPLLAVPQRASEEKFTRILDALRGGKRVSLITDAGTPGISDPGNEVVERTIRAGYEVSPVPGPSALAAILSVAGIDTSEFCFKGFPPHKKGRETFFRAVSDSLVPVVYYDSPYRVIKNLELLSTLSPERNIVLGRELTKVFEEVLRGNVVHVLEYYEKHPEKVKGEFVLMVFRGKS